MSVWAHVFCMYVCEGLHSKMLNLFGKNVTVSVTVTVCILGIYFT